MMPIALPDKFVCKARILVSPVVIKRKTVPSPNYLFAMKKTECALNACPISIVQETRPFAMSPSRLASDVWMMRTVMQANFVIRPATLVLLDATRKMIARKPNYLFAMKKTEFVSNACPIPIVQETHPFAMLHFKSA